MSANDQPAYAVDFSRQVSRRITAAMALAGVRSSVDLARRVGWKEDMLDRRLRERDPVPWRFTEVAVIATALGWDPWALIGPEWAEDADGELHWTGGRQRIAS